MANSTRPARGVLTLRSLALTYLALQFSVLPDSVFAPAGESTVALSANPRNSSSRAPSLTSLLVELSTHHPRVRSLSLAAAAYADAARAAHWKYPDPNFSIALSNAPYKSDLRVIRDQTPMTGIEYRLSQAIPFPGRLSTQANLKDIRAREALLKLSVAKNDLSYSFLSDAREALTLATLTRLTESYALRFGVVSDSARTRYSVGRGTLADVSGASLSRGNFREAARRLAGQRDARVAMLRYYLRSGPTRGDAESTAWLISDQGAGALKKYRERLLGEIERASRAVERFALDVALRDLQVDAARERRTLARLQVLPDFEVFAAYREREKIESDPAFGEDFYSVGLRIRVPLWSALSAGHEADSAQNQERASQISRSDAIEHVSARLAALRADFASATERLALYDARLIPDARRARDSARLAYQTGRIDFFALVSSWNALYAQESERIRLAGERDRIVFRMAALLNVLVPEYQTEANPSEENENES